MADGSAPPNLEIAPGHFRVMALSRPLSDELLQADLPVGHTLGELGLGAPGVHAYVNGREATDPAVMPADGDFVTLLAVPRGFISDLGPLAFLLNPFVAIGDAILGFALDTIAGLIPLPNLESPDVGGRGLQAVTTTNRAIPYAPVRRLYGTQRIYPLLGSRQYTETVGDTQYVRMLFDCGRGPLTFDKDSLRIGETPIAAFGIDVDDTGPNKQIEFREGTGAEPDLTLFTRSVVEQSLSVGLNTNYDGVTEADSRATRTTEPGTREITLELACPQLVRRNDEGKVRTAWISFRVEIRPTGGGGFTEVSPTHPTYPGAVTGDATYGAIGDADVPSSYDEYLLAGNEGRPYRATVRIIPSTPGQFDLRVTRLMTFGDNVGPQENGNEGISADMSWVALRSFGADIAQTYDKNTALIALRIQITDQLGSSIDNLSLVASSRLPVWNGSSFVTQVTSNPAWVYRDVLSGNAWQTPLPTTSIDDEALKTWATYCTANGFEFNGEFAEEITVFEAAKAVAATGRASFRIAGGLFGVTVDRNDLTPRQLFTPRNHVNFQWSKNFVRPAHAVRCQFKNREADWQDDERIVYADGYSLDGAGGTEVATRFESLTLFGYTDADQVYKEARYRMKVAALRPESFTWTADIASIVSRRGDVVHHQEDSILVGLDGGSGRILSLSGGSITLDTDITLQGGPTYAARICKDDATTVQATITTGAGTTRTLALSGGVPAGVKVGDLVAVGESTKVTQTLLITDIKRAADLRATITAVPYSPAVHDAGAIPPYDPLITRPLVFPPAPVILNVSERFRRTDQGPRVPRVVVSYRVPSSEVPIRLAELEYRTADSLTWVEEGSRAPRGIYSFGVPDGGINYVLRLRLVAENGLPSAWAEANVIFVDDPAGDLTTITLQEFPNFPQTENGDRSTILIAVTPPLVLGDYSHALVERQRLGSQGWRDVGRTDVDGLVEDIQQSNGRTYRYRARAVSTSGRIESDGPIAEITLTDADGLPPAIPDPGAIPDAALNITGLRIVGQSAMVSNFTGPDLSMTWDAPTPSVGQKIRQYRVRISDTLTSIVIAQLNVRRRRFQYTLLDNTDDSIQALAATGPTRALTVEVAARTDKGFISAVPQVRAVENPAPVFPATFTIVGSLNGIRIVFRRPTDRDYTFTRVYASQVMGFTPDDDTVTGNQVFEGADTKPILITDLAAGLWYVRVRLYDEFGEGTLSAEYTATVGVLAGADVTAPPVPTGLALTWAVENADQVTDVSITATFDRVVDPEGALVTYELELWPNVAPARSRTRKIDDRGPDPTIATTFSAVGANRAYTARIRARDASGNVSAWSATAGVTTGDDVTAPANVTSFTAVVRVGRFVLKWVNPVDQDFFLTDVHRGTTAGFTPDTSAGSATRVYTGRGIRFADTEVAVGTTYYYKTRTLDRAGNASAFSAASGPHSLTSDEQPKDVTAPPTPTGLTLTSTVLAAGQVTDVDLRAAWSTVVDPEGSAVRYELQLWPTAAPTRIRTRTIKDTEVTFEGVGPNRGYTARVRAVDEFGNASAWSATVAHTTGVDTVAPANTTGLTLVGRTGFIVVKWTSPTDEDLARIEVQRATNSGFTTNVQTVFSGLANRYPDREVDGGTTYWYRTRTYDRAENTSGYGSSANITASGDPQPQDVTAPTVPTGLALSSNVEGTDLTSDVSLTATWSSSTDPDGSAIEYDLELWPTAAPARIRRRKTPAFAVTFEGVGRNRGYTARIRAIDSSGNASAWSGTVSHTTNANSTAVSNVTGATATAGLHHNILEWVNPTAENFLEVELHRGTSSSFTASGSTLIYKGRGTVFIDDTATIGTAYWYRWRTLSANGTNSGYSATVGSVASFRITSGNIGTYINSLAIGNAYIDNLDAVKITAGTLNAARIGAGTITADKLNVNGTVALSSTGAIYASKTTYASTTAGFWLGLDSGTAKFNIGNASNSLNWNGSGLTVTGVIQTAASGQRVVLTSGNETEFYDDFGSKAVTIGIDTAAGVGEAYISGGLPHAGTAVGNATQQGRIGVVGYSVLNAGVAGISDQLHGTAGITYSSSASAAGVYGTSFAGGASLANGVWGIAADGAGVLGEASGGWGVKGDASSGIGVLGLLSGSPSGNGWLTTITEVALGNAVKAFVGDGGATITVALAARGNVGGVFQQQNNNTGAILVLKESANGNAVPTYTAEAGAITRRTIGGVTRLYRQTAGGFNGSGSTWVEFA